MKIIIDVRNRNEFLKKHVKSAINIPVFDLKFFLNLLRGNDIYVYCNSGRKTRIALELLEKNGIIATKVELSDFNDNTFVENKNLVYVIFRIKTSRKEEFDFETLIKEFFGEAMKYKGFLGASLLKKKGNEKEVVYIVETLWEKIENYEKAKSSKLETLLEYFKEEKIVEEIVEEVYEPLR